MTTEEFADIVGRVAYRDWSVSIGTLEGGWVLRWWWLAEDAYAPGARVRQESRPWLIESEWTEDQVVKTVFLALVTALEHEAREEFRYKDRRVFNPHITVKRMANTSSQR